MPESKAVERGAEPARDFDTLFESNHQAVFRYCVRRLGPSEAEDAAADVFAIAWRRFDQVPTGESARAWLFGVAYKVVGNRYRARRRNARLSKRIESERLMESRDSLQGDPQIHLVHQALEKLSSTDRELIRLASWDGLSRSEIATVLGIRVNAVDQRLHRARSRMKTHIDRLTAGSQNTRPEGAAL